MNAYSMLGQGNFLMANKHIAKETSLNAAILLADLLSKREYFIINKDLSRNDWFFNTADNIELDTTLTKHQQTKALKQLKEAGFIDYNNKTVGNKRQFLIFDVCLVSFLSGSNDGVKSQKLKKRSLEVKKAEARIEKSGSSYNKSIEQEQKNKNKLITTETKNKIPVDVAFNLVANGATIHKSQVTEETYNSLFSVYGVDEHGNIDNTPKQNRT